MQGTIQLLDAALKQHPTPYWHEKLGLSRNALYNARDRGNLSPAIAGALADAMGLDPQPWIVIAALEGEKESQCKTRMVRKFLSGAALAGAALTSALPASAATVLQAAREIACALCLIARRKDGRIKQALSYIRRPAFPAFG